MDEENGLPLYYQLKEILRENINKGVWISNEKIPTENELAKKYDISRATVRQAVLSLVREGLLYRKRGVGTFVSRPKLEADFINFYFPNELGTEHKMIKVKEIEYSESIFKLLNLEEDKKVFELYRIRLFNEEPAALEKSYIPIHLVPNFQDLDFSKRLYDLLNENYGLEIAKAENQIEPIILDEYEGEKLEVGPLTPALKISRVGKLLNNQPIVVTKSIIRGDRCKIFLKSD